MGRELVISNGQGYGEGIYDEGVYGGFSSVKIADNWNFVTSINSQKTFTFTIIENPNSIELTEGLECKFLADDVVKFAGIIWEIKPYELVPNQILYDVICVTFDKLAQKRKINSSFTNKTAGYIIRYIVNNVLYQEGITIGEVQDGPTFENVVFNLKSCYEAFDKIKVASPGYNWHINYNKQIYFVARATYKSSTTINSSFQHSGFKPSNSLNEYRNLQYIIGGLRETSLIEGYSPSPKPDGVARDFTVKFPIAREPTIYVNSVAVSASLVGTNYDTGMTWTWSYGSDKITHSTDVTALSDTDTLEIDFIGLDAVRLKYEDSSKVSAKSEIEGNSGLYEEVYTNTDIVTNAEAVKYAKGLIEKFENNQVIDIEVDNDIGDFEINKLVKVEKSLFNIDDWYLIESISATFQNPNFMRYKLKLIHGEFVGNYEDYFASLLSIKNEINSNEVFVEFKGINEIWNLNGTYNINTVECLAPSLSLAPSLNLAPGSNLVNHLVYD